MGYQKDAKYRKEYIAKKVFGDSISQVPTYPQKTTLA
jgi:hypothetical protein